VLALDLYALRGVSELLPFLEPFLRDEEHRHALHDDRVVILCSHQLLELLSLAF